MPFDMNYSSNFYMYNTCKHNLNLFKVNFILMFNKIKKLKRECPINLP